MTFKLGDLFYKHTVVSLNLTPYCQCWFVCVMLQAVEGDLHGVKTIDVPTAVKVSFFTP